MRGSAEYDKPSYYFQPCTDNRAKGVKMEIKTKKKNTFGGDVRKHFSIQKTSMCEVAYQATLLNLNTGAIQDTVR